MKNLIYLFLTLLIVACGKTVNEREEGQYLTREKKVQYYKGIPFSGTLVKDDEWSIETREFKEGLLDGVTEFYYSYKKFEDDNMNNEIYRPYVVSEKYDGYVLTDKGYYEDNVLVFTEEYHPNGQLKSKNKIMDNGRSLELLRYDENGQSW
tara:strand:- start:668 stop:1120 length:453 start_codon:yes stop_codon:yes gene_type:complete